MLASFRALVPTCAGLLMLAATAGAQPPVPAGLLEARRAYNAALSSGDKAAYAKLLTEDVTWTNRSGRVQDKASRVGELPPDATASSQPAPEIRIYPGGAVLIGTRSGNIRSIQAWVPKGGQWQLAAHQGTAIAGVTPGLPADTSVTPSSKSPTNAGSTADIAAIAKAMDAVSAANAKGDGQAFASLVTDRFVVVNAQGQVLSRADRIKEITGKPGPVPVGTHADVSTRVHGDLAVTTLMPAVSAGQPRLRQTIVHVRQGGTWLRAANIMTPIAAKP